MPPKKAQIATFVGEYDVELMNASELKTYIEALLEEHERMRENKSLYHKDKNELLNLLMCMQEKIADQKQVSLQKNFETEQLSQDFEKQSRHNDQLIKMKELEHAQVAERDLFESFVRVKIAKIEHREKEYEILKDINDREREIQSLKYVHELMTVEMEESLLGVWMNLNSASKSKLERRLVEYNKKFHAELGSLANSKIETFSSILEGCTKNSDNGFAEFVEKMSDYYKNLFCKNIKTIKDLVNKLTKLKGELNVLNLNLRDIRKLNSEFEVSVEKPYLAADSINLSPVYSRTKMMFLEKMSYENYVLSIKLGMLKKEYDDLKAKFTSAVRKMYQKADFKALLLERRLQALKESHGTVDQYLQTVC